MMNKKLKIEGVGKEPIFKSDDKACKPRSLDKFRTQANHKRIDSLLEKRKAYSQQKTAIQAALSYTNSNKSNKIIFSDNDDTGKESNEYEVIAATEKKSKKSLFDEDSEAEDGNEMFEISEKFQGKSGAKLLKLQSTYKNDERFKLNEKFLEETEEKQQIEEDIVDIEQEKKREIEILGDILGHEVKTKFTSTYNHAKGENEIKTMKRFDPKQPDHVKYEMKKEQKNQKNKIKKDNTLEEKKVDAKEEPEVSKEVFYSVKEDLKNSLETDKGFSLLSMFGTAEEKVEEGPDLDTGLPIKKKKYSLNDNPFKYDSSDEEDQTDQIVPNEKTPATKNTIKAWTEPFFFQEDDFRLQEGVDFVQRIATQNKEDFMQTRRSLKEIAKTKVRKILRKNKPFRKKLGGSKKKKMKRMNKALNR